MGTLRTVPMALRMATVAPMAEEVSVLEVATECLAWVQI